MVLNTITLSVEHYGIEPEVENILNISNQYFNWIFICEMFFKVVAMGVTKYSSDKMNLLDASVVFLSIAELVSDKIL